MKSKLAPVFWFIYFGISFVQFTAIMSGLVHWWGWPWLLAAVVAFPVAYIPVIGSVAGIMGAIHGFGWHPLLAILLFGWWVIFLVVLVPASALISSALAKLRGPKATSTGVQQRALDHAQFSNVSKDIPFPILCRNFAGATISGTAPFLQGIRAPAVPNQDKADNHAGLLVGVIAYRHRDLNDDELTALLIVQLSVCVCAIYEFYDCHVERSHVIGLATRVAFQELPDEKHEKLLNNALERLSNGNKGEHHELLMDLASQLSRSLSNFVRSGSLKDLDHLEFCLPCLRKLQAVPALVGLRNI